jgi:hypothetical protein
MFQDAILCLCEAMWQCGNVHILPPPPLFFGGIGPCMWHDAQRMILIFFIYIAFLLFCYFVLDFMPHWPLQSVLKITII